jgi:Sugar (pentulose and hexulose) kinases
MPVPVIAIFDVGKTNKKIILFNEQYEMVFEKTTNLVETVDDGGEVCENIQALTEWLLTAFNEVLVNPAFLVKAINFSTYGASLVYIDKHGKPLTPLYNYLKAFPEYLARQLYAVYGGKEKISVETASPALGSLNAGLQLYRLKYTQPGIFKQVAYAFHLPQFLSYLIADYPATDITSIGCHTALWNFGNNHYHHWVVEEKLDTLFAPLHPCSATVPIMFNHLEIQVGIGLHDSSAALIPYLVNFSEPFVLISTGTWCISLNPFNNEPLTNEELENDCLCYMTYRQNPVKASRLFAGNEHEQTLKKLAAHFNKTEYYFSEIPIHEEWLDVEAIKAVPEPDVKTGVCPSAFAGRDLNEFASYEEAYHCFISAIIQQQKKSLQYVLDNNVKRIFVDGGFSRNKFYMRLLATAFQGIDVYSACIPQSTAKGAAMAIHSSWNTTVLSKNIIEIKKAEPLQ